jgi:hypothetical protein
LYATGKQRVVWKYLISELQFLLGPICYALLDDKTGYCVLLSKVKIYKRFEKKIVLFTQMNNEYRYTFFVSSNNVLFCVTENQINGHTNE